MNSKRSWFTVAAGLAAMLAVATTANAQWTVIRLQPAGASFSNAKGVQGGQQVGYAGTGNWHASLWSGTAASWVDIHPAGVVLANAGSYANGVGDGQQVGVVLYNDGVANSYFASLWSGTAASWVDLSGGIAGSEAYGVAGGQQVGSVDLYACLWSGTAESRVNLNPAGADWSEAYGIGGGQQVGYASFGNVDRASLWSGTAASWVDLHPAAATYSVAYGVGGGQQVGIANVVGGRHASLWSGSAASWVDLHPAGSTGYSEARGVYGGKQVGWATVGDVQRASLWSGTAASWTDLNALLPSGSSSEATGIWSDADYIYVVGNGRLSRRGPNEALMWRRALVDPPNGPGTPTLTKLTGGQVRVSWADNSNNENGFRVQRETKSGANWINTQTVATVGANVTTTIDLPGVGTFRYRVQAFIGVSDSAWSAWAQIKN